MNQKQIKFHPKLSKKTELFRKMIENGIETSKVDKTQKENFPLKNHTHAHEKEEIQVNGKTIFITSKSQSYQIKKIINGNRTTYEINPIF